MDDLSLGWSPLFLDCTMLTIRYSAVTLSCFNKKNKKNKNSIDSISDRH
uniref:Uncharacterized protein n=1 Tax=Antheraea mylitta TaxID=34739 RepID=Q4W4D3_ANTMY|nr:hypothetical protein [Antheraea mylitta]